jgi:hypothetical protein
VQFFVEPALPPTPPPQQQQQQQDEDDARITRSFRTLTTVFGTHARPPIRSPLAAEGSDLLVGAWPGLFGALSSEAMYISNSNRGETRDGNGHVVATKIDVPRSYMISSVSNPAMP